MKRITHALIFSLIISAFVGRSLVYAQGIDTPVPPALRAAEHFLGDAKAPITVMVFDDTQCPFCQQLHGVLKSLQAKFPTTVKIAFRNFPITSTHEFAFKEAKALECADTLKGNTAYLTLLDRLYTLPDPFDFSYQPRPAVAYLNRPKHMRWLMRHARNSGVLRTKLSSCVSRNVTTPKVEADIAEAKAAGVEGTPTSFIYNKDVFSLRVDGAQPQEVFEQIVTDFIQKGL